jgi:pimeloyl-ACP methyl ester carboxylesterase
MPAPAEQGRIQVDGASLWWASFGAGDAVILLHGGAGNTEHWANQIPALARRFRVVVMAALRRMWRTQPDFKPDQLARITAVTACADGEHDEIVRQEHVRAMARLIPGARLVLIPDASHFALWQRPEAFDEALLDFLGESPPVTPRP